MLLKPANTPVSAITKECIKDLQYTQGECVQAWSIKINANAKAMQEYHILESRTRPIFLMY
jgi:hypothetical protein